MYKCRTGTKLSSHRLRSSKSCSSIQFEGNECESNNVYKALYDLYPQYSSSTGADSFKFEYLISSLLEKLPLPKYSSEYKAERAIEKMMDSERTCLSINHNGYRHDGFGYKAEWCNTIFSTAQRLIADLLDTPSLGMFEKAAFTAGASTSCRRRTGDPYYKYSSKYPVHVTPRAYKYARALKSLTPMWETYGSNIIIVPGNRITTVPKKTDIDRCIAMEPDCNMALQLCVGSYIRNRLRRVKQNLNDQTVNQRLAKEGSINNLLSTIDLSSASDSISIKLVRDLLPPDWFDLLDDLRSHQGTLPDGKLITWEKFSSMGNGFTFELETLIFWALSKACIINESKFISDFSGKLATLSVYGDDIICPSLYADNVILILDHVGFVTNKEKTFTTGPFRESCGKHYYNGTDVTPFYVRKPLDRIPRFIWLLNAIRRWSTVDSISICDPRTYDIWKLYSKFVPRCLFGGDDIVACDSVASPGKLKKRLVSCFNRRDINGPFAILRWFQYNQLRINKLNRYSYTCHLKPNSLLWARLNDDFIDELDTAGKWGTQIVSPITDIYRYKPNISQWRSIPLYSNEIV